MKLCESDDEPGENKSCLKKMYYDGLDDKNFAFATMHLLMLSYWIIIGTLSLVDALCTTIVKIMCMDM